MTSLFDVVEPGIFTTIQDLGRPHAISSGVPPGGAMDRFAHTAANLLVGNDRSAATLECTVRGPRLAVLARCAVAVTGADLDLRVNGREAPQWTSLALKGGDELSFVARKAGARAYVAVAGGIAGDRWLGSASTYLTAARGGMHGRALVAGDVIGLAAEVEGMPAGRELPAEARPDYTDHTLRVVPGPHVDRLTDESRHALFQSVFALGHDSDRMGYRLDGPALRSGGDELLSFGLVAGALQLPPGGRPILLMAEHQTAGGYPVIAVVISASMSTAAQLAPGDELRFEETDLESALKLRADQRAALDAIS